MKCSDHVWAWVGYDPNLSEPGGYRCVYCNEVGGFDLYDL